MSRRDRLLLAGLLATVAACTYAWPTGTTPLDASSDAPTDASLADRLIGDATVDVATDAPPPRDGGPDSAPNCAALKAAVDTKHGLAKACPNLGLYCFTLVFDECNCESWVLDASAPSVAGYESAVAALKSSGCPISCPAGRCKPHVVSGACVIVEAGAAQECSP
jgi:hypothetical protein